MLPRWAYLTLGLFLAGSIVLAVYQKNQEGTRGGYAQVLSERIEPGFAAYVLGYSGGVQSRVAPVRVRFTSPIKTARAGEKAKASLLTLKPDVEGSLKWEDAQTLVFTPKQPLGFGAVHQVQVALGKLMPVEEGFGEFKFSFITPRQGARIRGLGWVESGTTLEGRIVLADFEKSDQVEAAFRATLEGAEAPQAKWEHSGDGLTHTFRLPNLMPYYKGKSLMLHVLKRLPGMVDDYSFKTDLPAADGFALWNVEEQSGPDREILLSFTDDLDPKQDLSGMVALEGFPPLRVWAEGSRVRIALPLGAVERAQDEEEGGGEGEQVYYDRNVRATGLQTLRLGAGLRSLKGETLPGDVRSEIVLEPGKPSVRLVEQGMILPPLEGRKTFLPFEAVGLRQARVTIYRIGPANALHFLQSINEYGSDPREFYQQKLGRPVGTVVLNLAAAGYPDARQWRRYRADLTPWLQGQAGAFHFAQISFDKGMTDWTCTGRDGSGSLMAVNPFGQQESLTGFDDDGYLNRNYYEEGGEEYDYTQDENPCNPAYYSGYSGEHRTSAGLYLVASNLGVTAKKQADGTLKLAFTNLKTAGPEDGVEVLVYSKQLELLGRATSGSGGFAAWNGKRAYCVMARKGEDYAYLKVENGAALATAGFDVGGSATQEGDRAFIYTERGVYRPGDTLHIGTMLEGEVFKRSQRLPQVLELDNPSDQTVARLVRLSGKENHARFDIPTAADWPTGVYRLRLRSGGLTETKAIAIETVKPNRLKVDLKTSQENLLAGYGLTARLASKWLFGAPAPGYKFNIEARPLRTPWRPAGLDNYSFDDVTKEQTLPEDRLMLAESDLDGEGNATLTLKPQYENLYRPLGLGLTTTVFEPGGDFSTDYTRIFLHPYAAYVGIGSGEEDGLYQNYETGKPVKLNVVNISPLNGKPVPKARLDVKITRLDWRWWWQEEQGSYVYVDNATEKVYKEETLELPQGKGMYSFTTNNDHWGRYLIRITNSETGHTASRVVYVGYPSDDMMPDGDMLTRVGLSVDKKSYKPGQTATLSCGRGAEGTRALVSLERGGKVMEQFWAEPKGGQGKIPIPIKPEYGPNAYAFVSLMLPHAESRASRPLRRYGVVNITIESDAGRLKPAIALPEYARPNSALTVKVSETQGKGMSYMLMMVDEGLLDLTRFKTPDPYSALYGRLALEVRSFDMYGQVISSGALEASRLAATGGDAEAKDKQEEARNKLRFEAVSRMYGPFVLREGTSAEHRIPMPEYTGSVRMMVVASGSHGMAYGSAEKALAVRSELILNGTAPRFLLPGDRTLLGLSVEFMKKGLTKAEVSVSTTGQAKIEGGKVSFSGRPAFLPLTAGAPGTAGVTATGTAGGFTSKWSATIPVQSGTRPVRETELIELKPGETKSMDLKLKGQANSDAFSVEASPGLPFPLQRSLDYLIHYPYGCAEQTLSATVAQMLLPGTVKLDAAREAHISANVMAGLGRLAAFKTATGGLSLWPGETSNHSWASAYGLHALKLARARGYSVNSASVNDLEGFVSSEARAYSYSAERQSDQILQAYRLYALAPSQVEEMNRLQQVGSLVPQAQWLLAAALAKAGRAEEAARVVENKSTEPAAIPSAWDIFHTTERDQALILLGLSAIKAPAEQTLPLAKQLAGQIAADRWANTQEIVWALLALEPYLGGGNQARGVNVNAILGGKVLALASTSGPDVEELGRKPGLIQLKNKGHAPCYVTVTHRYEPRPGEQLAQSEGIGLSVNYEDNKGNPVNLSGLKQGQNLLARVTVMGELPGIYMDNLALTWFAPAGFEIRNDRLTAPEEPARTQFEHQVEHRDIRDDKVRWFFSLGASKQKTFTVPITAAYPGSYTLPSTTVEDMYHPERRANTAAGRVEINNAPTP